MEQNIIDKLVQASGVSSGELVLIHFWGDDSDKAIANNFMKAVVTLGATPLLLQQSRVINKDIFALAKDSCFSEKYFSLLSSFDAVLDVFAYQPVVLGYEIAEDKFKLYQKYMAQLFSNLMKIKRFTQIRIPTIANAKESGLEPKDFIARMTTAYDVDYTILQSSCEDMVKKYSQTNMPVLRTGKDCELHLDLTDRKWHIDAGDGDLPCGEIYIAPVEDKTNGTIYFEKLFLEEVGIFEDVSFHVINGQITNSNNEAINSFLNDLPEKEKTVCEFGIGMNPNIHSLCGYTVLDEKMANTFHIAIGANTMFGGHNDASNHIDLVGMGEVILNKE